MSSLLLCVLLLEERIFVHGNNDAAEVEGLSLLKNQLKTKW